MKIVITSTIHRYTR